MCLDLGEDINIVEEKHFDIRMFYWEYYVIKTLKMGKPTRFLIILARVGPKQCNYCRSCSTPSNFQFFFYSTDEDFD